MMSPNWSLCWKESSSSVLRIKDIAQHLYADKGYDGLPALQVIVTKGYVPLVKRRGARDPGKKKQSQLESQKVGG